MIEPPRIPAFVVETRLGSAGVVFVGDDGAHEFVSYDARFRALESSAYASIAEVERAAGELVRQAG